MTDRFVVLSGCSGGGKSTLLAELARRGYAVVDEPGRRIVREEMARGGRALPWIDAEAFLRRAIATALTDRQVMSASAGWVFFDRGLIDAISGLEHLTGEPALAEYGPAHRYCATVFLTPPWPEIYENDAERKHGFEQAKAEYVLLVRDYARLGYRTVDVPKRPVGERAAFVLSRLARARAVSTP